MGVRRSRELDKYIASHTMRRHDHQSVQRLFAAAMAAGALRLSQTSIRWNIAGRCENPYWRIFHAKPEAPKGRKKVVVKRDTKTPLTVELGTPCRACEPCNISRGALWRHKARAEIAIWPRTWFGTLTFRPEVIFELQTRARHKATLQGQDFDADPAITQARLLDAECRPEVQKFIKRVRKNTGAPVRTLVIGELHKSGLPHYHMLLHEMDAMQPVRHAQLASAWKLGFSNFKLCDLEGSRYISKYLTKAAHAAFARVRASQQYGKPHAILIDRAKSRETDTGNRDPNEASGLDARAASTSSPVQPKE